MSFNPDSGAISGSSDAAISNPADGQLLAYNSGIGKWTNNDNSIAAVSGLQTALDEKAGTETTPAIIMKSGANYPLRSTVTSDASRVVIWMGDTLPTIGGGYAQAGVDVHWSTA